jgi:hypothetical protein
MTRFRSNAVAVSEDEHADQRADKIEQALLGALLLDCAKSWPDVKDRLSFNDFARHEHRTIFAAIAGLMEEGGVVDVHLTIDRLGEKLEEAGGAAYIVELYEGATSAASTGAYIKRIRERAGHSKVIDFANAFAAKARNLEPDDALQFGAERIEHLRREREDDAPAKPKPDRRPLRWMDLEGEAPPVRTWRISHWLTSGPTLLAGSGGVGKTLIAQTIATALALGRSFIDEIHESAPVLFWACEDDHDELWRRQVAICRYFGVLMGELEGKLIIEPRLGRDNTLFSLTYGAPVWTPLRDELKQQLGDYGARILFLDNIGQTYGGKENDRYQVTTFVNGLAGLAPDVSPVIMGHPAKAAESEFSGSTAWENSVRMRWYMGYKLPDQKLEEGETEDPNTRYLAKRKTNYSDKDYRKLEFRDGLFVPDVNGPGEFARRYGYHERMENAAACIIHALERLAQASVRTTDSRNSPDYLPRKMREAKLAADYTDKELREALSKLRLDRKVIEGQVGKYNNRASKIGLVLA